MLFSNHALRCYGASAIQEAPLFADSRELSSAEFDLEITGNFLNSDINLVF
jgi:hypothetical protein